MAEHFRRRMRTAAGGVQADGSVVVFGEEATSVLADAVVDDILARSGRSGSRLAQFGLEVRGAHRLAVFRRFRFLSFRPERVRIVAGLALEPGSKQKGLSIESDMTRTTITLRRSSGEGGAVIAEGRMEDRSTVQNLLCV